MLCNLFRWNNKWLNYHVVVHNRCVFYSFWMANLSWIANLTYVDNVITLAYNQGKLITQYHIINVWKITSILTSTAF